MIKEITIRRADNGFIMSYANVRGTKGGTVRSSEEEVYLGLEGVLDSIRGLWGDRE